MTIGKGITFAVVGDVEPKPDPNFDNFQATIRAINELKESMGITFTASVGDLAHQGKKEQYDAVTAILSDLTTPFYTLMGNEELQGGAELFFTYAPKWNDGKNLIPSDRYVVKFGPYTFIFATAQNGGVTFDEHEIGWMSAQVKNHSGGPVILFTHAPAGGVFPDAKERAMRNELIAPILQHNPHVVMHFSGHTHFDLDAVQHVAVDEYGVHHVHVPGIERTKVGPNHTPRFRIVQIEGDGSTTVHTYNVRTGHFEKKHERTFTMRG